MTNTTPDTIDVEQFTSQLNEELAQLETEMKAVAAPDRDEPGDWEPTVSNDNVDAGDPGDLANKAEEYRDHQAILHELEIRYANVKRALEKLSNGAFGFCEIDNKPIELDRLQANPAARTCKDHMDEESTLTM